MGRVGRFTGRLPNEEGDPVLFCGEGEGEGAVSTGGGAAAGGGAASGGGVAEGV